MSSESAQSAARLIMRIARAESDRDLPQSAARGAALHIYTIRRAALWAIKNAFNAVVKQKNER